MSLFRLAHLSDPHLPPPQGSIRRQPALKRLLSGYAWRRKGRRHRPEVLAAIVADMKALAPDHVAVTGDLTNFSAPEEFAAARSWLEQLACPDSVTVSPGNHDALVGRAGPERFATWAPWLGDDADAVFPKLRLRGPVALVNLCSAVATAPHLAQGELGRDQLERLRTLLAELRAKDLFRIVLVHHPVTPDVVSKRKSLRDADALREILREQGAELILHGHAHVAAVSSTPGPDGPIPVLGVPSASMCGGHDDPARWHCLEVDHGPAGWEVRVIARGLGRGEKIEELGRYVLAAP